MVERRAELDILSPVHADVGSYAVLLGDLRPPIGERGPVQGHALPHDGHQAPTGLKSQERLLDVPSAKGRAVAVYAAARSRKWRIHDDCMVGPLGRKKIVEPLGIERSGSKALERKQVPSPLVNLVRVDLGTGEAGQDGDIARTGARLKGVHAGAK